MKTIPYQPPGYHSVTPYLNVADADAFVDFVQRAFGATSTECVRRPDGKILHGEVRIGDSIVMLSEACDQMGPAPASLYLYVEDADAVYQRAVAAGASPVMEPVDMFWGDRYGCVMDAWNIQWSIGTHVEDVAPDELAQRAEAFARQMLA